MKKRSLLLLIPCVLVSSCGSKDPVGEWRNFIADNKGIVATNNERPSPFNTVMQLNYFLDEAQIKREDFDKEFNTITSLYQDLVVDLHKKFDRHLSYKDVNEELVTNTKTLNDSYGSNVPVKVSDELYQLLKLSVEAYDLTDGYFNVFTGQIVDLWNDIFYEICESLGSIKDFDPMFNMEVADELKQMVDALPSNSEEVKKQLTFDDENKTITFNQCDFNNGIRPTITLGGIAKGYATDIIKDTFKEKGYLNGYLISGGSSICTVDKPIYTSKENGQKVSVINPQASNIIKKVPAFSIKLQDEFNFSTSGNYTSNKSYQFYGENESIIYRHHIINPYTGYPENYFRSVSVKTSYFSNAIVDTLSTAFMSMSLKQGLDLRKKILKDYPEADLELFYIAQEGFGETAKVTVHATSDMNKTLNVNDGVNLIYEE